MKFEPATMIFVVLVRGGIWVPIDDLHRYDGKLRKMGHGGACRLKMHR